MTEPDNLVLVLLREMRDSLRRVEERLDRIEAQLTVHHDELTVVTGLALRATGERLVWDGLTNQLRKLTARVDALEGQPG